MSAINGVGNSQPSAAISKIVQNPIHKEVSSTASPQRTSADKLELSGMSHLLQTLKTNDIRVDKVQQIRAQIEAGTYETEDKLDQAANRLLDDLQR